MNVGYGVKLELIQIYVQKYLHVNRMKSERTIETDSMGTACHTTRKNTAKQ